MSSTWNDFHVFYEVVEYLWANRKKISREYEVFDYPDYAGIPERLLKHMSPKFLDGIAYFWPVSEYESKSSFKNDMKLYLFGCEVPDKALRGEPVQTSFAREAKQAERK